VAKAGARQDQAGYRHDHQHPDHVQGTMPSSSPPVNSHKGVRPRVVTVDHCSTGCVGIHAARRATRFEALEPLRQGVRTAFGAFAEGVAGGLKLRHDHGSQFVADDYQRELAFLGIASSPAFVREPEGNGCVERFIRTLKENLLWVRRFDTIEELRLALHAFRRTYNHTWIVERHRYQSPAAVRAAQLAPLHAAA
jgi:putative transposase